VKRPLRVRAWGFALALVAATTVLRLLLTAVWADRFPTLLFYLAVSVAAWFGGFAPGIAATVLSAVVVTSLSWPPEPDDVLGLVFFLAFGVVVSYLHERLRRNAAVAISALRASEARHRGLVERNLAGMFRARFDGTMLDCNPAFVRLLGWPLLDDVLARNAKEFYVDPEDRAELIRDIARGDVVTNREFRWRRADGSVITVLVNVLEAEPGVLEGIAIDISDQIRAQEAERAATEMQAITKLANAASHEINNPLTVVLGNLELMRRRMGADHHIDAIVRACREIEEIVGRMQHITRVELFDQDPALGEVLDIRKSSSEA
jgi:PAS domain S-box-containing protein